MVQDTQSTIGKMLAKSEQNSHRISVENTTRAIYDSGFLLLEEMVACARLPSEPALPLVHSKQINCSLVTFSFRAYLNLLPLKTYNQSNMSDRWHLNWVFVSHTSEVWRNNFNSKKCSS